MTPAILLGQLAIDTQFQGRGYSASLMYLALQTGVALSRAIGCFCVLTHPLDDGVRACYGRYGFEDMPFGPGRRMTVRIVDLIESGFGSV